MRRGDVVVRGRGQKIPASKVIKNIPFSLSQFYSGLNFIKNFKKRREPYFFAFESPSSFLLVQPNNSIILKKDGELLYNSKHKSKSLRIE